MKLSGKISQKLDIKNVIFTDLSKKYYGSELLQNYISLHQKFLNKTKFKPKNLEKIYVTRNIN